MACIRRILLDAFWSRAPSTVTRHALKVEEGFRLSNQLGLSGPYLATGPLPDFDHCGYEVAMQMVLASTHPGKYSRSSKQWDTVRKLRTAYSNQVRASALPNSIALSVGDADGKSYQRIAPDECSSLWFQRFLTGCRTRMGQDHRPDKAISTVLVHRLLQTIEDRYDDSDDEDEKEFLVYAGAYYAFSYVLSLRGSEGLLVDLEALIRLNALAESRSHLFIPLFGKIKGENHSRHHNLSSVMITSSGVNMKRWVCLVIAQHATKDRRTGPAFVGKDGFVLSGSSLNDLLHDVLCDIWRDAPGIFPVDIEGEDDIHTKYNIFRSFRRGSSSRASAKDLSQNDVYAVNRWSKKEKAKSNKVSHPINHHYTDYSELIPNFLRYTQAM